MPWRAGKSSSKSGLRASRENRLSVVQTPVAALRERKLETRGGLPTFTLPLLRNLCSVRSAYVVPLTRLKRDNPRVSRAARAAGFPSLIIEGS